MPVKRIRVKGKDETPEEYAAWCAADAGLNPDQARKLRTLFINYARLGKWGADDILRMIEQAKLP